MSGSIQLEAPTSLFDDFEDREAPVSLDELIAGVWERLGAHRPARCPICEGSLEPQYGAHARPVGGRCSGCATTLR